MFSSVKNVSAQFGGYLVSGLGAAYTGLGYVAMAPISAGRAVTNGVLSLAGRAQADFPHETKIDEAAWIIINPISDPECNFEKLLKAAVSLDVEYFGSNLQFYQNRLSVAEFDRLFEALPFPINDNLIRKFLMVCDSAIESKHFVLHLEFSLNHPTDRELVLRLARKENIRDRFFPLLINSFKSDVDSNVDILKDLLSRMTSSSYEFRDSKTQKNFDSIFEGSVKGKHLELLQILREKEILISAYAFNTQMQKVVTSQDADLVRELLKFSDEYNHKAALQDWAYEAKSPEIKGLFKAKLKK